MDYRDPDGYFKDDVLSVLGRPGGGGEPLSSSMSSSGELPPPRYGSLASSVFTDNEPQTNVYMDDNDGENGYASDTTSTGITVSLSGSEMTEKGMKVYREEEEEEDPEWEEAKRVLYTAFVGLLLPIAFRFVGRRVTFSLWTKFLTSYFKI
ncbi:hypothetical protein EV175_006592 [Coemansia sp. RSA 1933]|nr:hypothetical protein EV175_006592 [Coemansia sp. RSA 1933]